MDKADIVRELDKIGEALDWASMREERNSEANAAQHCSDKVLYSPLYTKLFAAKEALLKISDELLS